MKARSCSMAARCYIRNRRKKRAPWASAMVFQHFRLFDTLSVAENVWLGLDKSMSLAEVTAPHPRSGAANTAWRSTPPAPCTTSAWVSASAWKSSVPC